MSAIYCDSPVEYRPNEERPSASPSLSLYVLHETIEAAVPPELVLLSEGFVGYAFVGDDHFGRGTSRLKANGDSFRRAWHAFQLPGVREKAGRFDNFKLSTNP